MPAKHFYSNFPLFAILQVNLTMEKTRWICTFDFDHSSKVKT